MRLFIDKFQKCIPSQQSVNLVASTCWVFALWKPTLEFFFMDSLWHLLPMLKREQMDHSRALWNSHSSLAHTKGGGGACTSFPIPSLLLQLIYKKKLSVLRFEWRKSQKIPPLSMLMFLKHLFHDIVLFLNVKGRVSTGDGNHVYSVYRDRVARKKRGYLWLETHP